MASTKGIAITAAIVIGVVGASMLVWLGPQSEPDTAGDGQDVTSNNINIFRSNEVLGSIYSRHQNLATEVDFNYDKWKAGDIDSSRMLRIISDAKDDTTEMRDAFEAANPPEEWQQSFDLYAGALDSFSSYLDEMENIVRQGDKTSAEAALDQYRQNSDEKVELALSAMPS